MSDTTHLIDRVNELERQLAKVTADRDHFERLWKYEANERAQMLRWRQDFEGKTEGRTA